MIIELFELMRGQIENDMIFNAASYFNLGIQKYYENEPRFNGVYSRNNLPKIRDWAYVTNLGKHKSKGAHWKALYVNGNNVWASNNAAYFDSVGVEHILKEIKKFIGKRNITKIFF